MGLQRPGGIDDLTEDEVDEVLGALLRQAATDDQAALALLRLLLPTCRRFADAHAAPDRRAELAAAAVGAALAEVWEWALAEGHVPAASCAPFVFGWAALMTS